MSFAVLQCIRIARGIVAILSTIAGFTRVSNDTESERISNRVQIICHDILRAKSRADFFQALETLIAVLKLFPQYDPVPTSGEISTTIQSPRWYLVQASNDLHEILGRKSLPHAEVLTVFHTALWRLNMFEFYEHNGHLPAMTPYTLLAELDVQSLTKFAQEV
jgi:hypothetical protein